MKRSMSKSWTMTYSVIFYKICLYKICLFCILCSISGPKFYFFFFEIFRFFSKIFLTRGKSDTAASAAPKASRLADYKQSSRAHQSCSSSGQGHPPNRRAQKANFTNYPFAASPGSKGKTLIPTRCRVYI